MTEEELRLCDALGDVAALRSPAEVDRYVELLQRLSSSDDPGVLRRLLGALYDADAGEAQYELVELCEQFPDAVYVPALLEQLEGMRDRAPTRTRLMLQSVLNTPASRRELELAAPDLPVDDQKNLLATLRAIADDDTQYRQVVDAIATLVGRR